MEHALARWRVMQQGSQPIETAQQQKVLVHALVDTAPLLFWDANLNPATQQTAHPTQAVQANAKATVNQIAKWLAVGFCFGLCVYHELL
jgi:hypothetical protein